MKLIIFFVITLAAWSAVAQEMQPSSDSSITALGQMVYEAVNREAHVRTQLIAAQARIAALEAAAKASAGQKQSAPNTLSPPPEQTK